MSIARLVYTYNSGGELDWDEGMGIVVSATGLMSVALLDNSQVDLRQFADATEAEEALPLIEADIQKALEAEGGVEVIIIDDYLSKK